MANAAFMASSNLISVPPFVALSGAKATGSVGDINPLSGTAAIAETSGQLGGLSAAPFSDLLSDAVGQIDALEGQARSAWKD